jgi:hypothetical protein
LATIRSFVGRNRKPTFSASPPVVDEGEETKVLLPEKGKEFFNRFGEGMMAPVC